MVGDRLLDDKLIQSMPVLMKVGTNVEQHVSACLLCEKNGDDFQQIETNDRNLLGVHYCYNHTDDELKSIGLNKLLLK